MNGQVAIPDPGDPRPQTPPLCRWCGEMAQTEIEVEPGARSKHPLTGKTIVAPAVAPVCRPCERRLEEHKAEGEKRRVAEREAKRNAKGQR